MFCSILLAPMNGYPNRAVLKCIPDFARPGSRSHPFAEVGMMRDQGEGEGGTLRRLLMQRLEAGACGVRELSQELHQSEKEIYQHLQYVGRTMRRQGGDLVVSPPLCQQCGYLFKDRTRTSPPGRCARNVDQPAFAGRGIALSGVGKRGNERGVCFTRFFPARSTAGSVAPAPRNPPLPAGRQRSARRHRPGGHRPVYPPTVPVPAYSSLPPGARHG